MMEETLLASIFLCFVLSSSLTLFSFQFFELVLDSTEVWEGRWKGTEKVINWLFWAEYFSNVILSAGHFCGFLWASHPWRPLTFRFVDPLKSISIVHGHFDSLPQSIGIKCLLASCSWNFFVCPGVPASLGSFWRHGSSVYWGTHISSTRNIHTSLVPTKIWERSSMPTGPPCHKSFWLAEVWVKLQSSVPINCKGKSSCQLGATGSTSAMLERHEIVLDHFSVLSRWEKAQSMAFSEEIPSQIFSHFHSLSPFLLFIFSRWVRWIYRLGNYCNFLVGRNSVHGDLFHSQFGTDHTNGSVEIKTGVVPL